MSVVLILVAFLSYADSPYRIIAILENERKLEAEPAVKLSSFFKSKDANIRSRALLAAGRIGNPAILPALQSLAKDSSSDVRAELAFALGQIRSRKALPLAIALLKDSDQNVQRLAIEAIGKIGALESVSEITPFLDHQQPEIREQTALALALIKDRNATEILIDKTKKEDPAQWSYVYALYRLADRRAIPVLHEVLSHPTESPSTGDPSSILFALKTFWTLKEPLTDAEYKSLLQHSDQRVRQNALDVLEQAGAVKDAIQAYETAVLLDPTSAGAWVNLGTIYFNSRQLAKAETHYRRALEADPSYALAHFNIGNLYDERGDYDRALHHYKHAVDLSPQYADAHYNLALLYQGGGHTMDAVRHWKLYLKLDPVSSWSAIARRELDKLRKSAVLRSSRRQTGTESILD